MKLGKSQENAYVKHAKDWIINNQAEDGRITWDEKGKCDPWDHCECLNSTCLIRGMGCLSIKGVEWFFNTLSQDGLIYPEFKNNQHTHMIISRVIMLHISFFH